MGRSGGPWAFRDSILRLEGMLGRRPNQLAVLKRRAAERRPGSGPITRWGRQMGPRSDRFHQFAEAVRACIEQDPGTATVAGRTATGTCFHSVLSRLVLTEIDPRDADRAAGKVAEAEICSGFCHPGQLAILRRRAAEKRPGVGTNRSSGLSDGAAFCSVPSSCRGNSCTHRTRHWKCHRHHAQNCARTNGSSGALPAAHPAKRWHRHPVAPPPRGTATPCMHRTRHTEGQVPKVQQKCSEPASPCV
jgi:hypothetical protein